MKCVTSVAHLRAHSASRATTPSHARRPSESGLVLQFQCGLVLGGKVGTGGFARVVVAVARHKSHLNPVALGVLPGSHEHLSPGQHRLLRPRGAK